MRITKVSLENVRRFTFPLELELSAGVNLIYGPNEAGKSTVAAAIQAVFLERANSTPVQGGLAPYRQGSAAPRVEVRFEHAGQEYRLTKEFGGNRGRTELELGGSLIHGEEAETHIANLLRFQLPGRGASRPDTRGITALTWINQGSDTNLSEQLASSHSTLLGIVDTGGASDRRSAASTLAARIEDRIRQRGGRRSRGDLGSVNGEIERHEREIEEITGELDRLSEQASRLDQLREGDDEGRARRRAAGYRKDLERASQDRKDLETRGEKLSNLEEQAKAAEAAEALHLQHLDTLRRERREFEEGSGKLQREQERLGTLQGETASARDLHDRWRGRVREIEDAVAAREQRRKRFEDRKKLEEARSLRGGLEADLEQALELEARIASAGRRLPGFTQQEFDDVQLRWQELEERRIRLEAVSGSLKVTSLGGLEILLDGQPVAGEREETLARSHRILVPGVIEVATDPGTGTDDWGKLEADRRDLAAEIGRLGASGFADLTARNAERGSATLEIEVARAAYPASARNGLEPLKLQIEQLRAEEAALEETAAGAGEIPVEGDHSTEEELAEARELERSAKDELSRSESDLAAAKATVATLEASLGKSSWRLNPIQAEADLDKADREHEQAKVAAEAAREQVSVARQAFDPGEEQRLASEIDRLTKAEKSAQEEAEAVRDEMTAIKTTLYGARASENHSRLEQLEAELEIHRRRQGQLKSAIAGLELLKQAATTQIEALREQLTGPIRERLNSYFGLLNTGKALEITDSFMPERSSPEGRESFELLSYGTREQLATLTRLAFLDLVAESGVPAFLILDDALVNSDNGRLQGMARVLYEAGKSHQILVFTCHIDRWDQVGPSTSIDLGSLGGS